MEKEMNTLTEAIEKLRGKEFIQDFYVEDNLLKCKDTKESFKPENVIIETTVRYEGNSDPDDMSIIYAITTHTGTMGLLIDAYGTYANPKISEFIRLVPVREESENQTK